MKISINDHRKLYALNEEFSRFYPELKLVFFAKPASAGGPASGKVMDYSKNVSECRSIHPSGELELSDEMPVFAAEEQFRDLFGITVSIEPRSAELKALLSPGKLSLREYNELARPAGDS